MDESNFHVMSYPNDAALIIILEYDLQRHFHTLNQKVSSINMNNNKTNLQRESKAQTMNLSQIRQISYEGVFKY